MALLYILVIAQVFGLTEECATEFGLFLQGYYDTNGTSKYAMMARYSAHRFNDLGDYDSCVQLKGAKYALVRNGPGLNVVLGFCVPDVCTEAEILDLLTGQIEQPLKTNLAYALQLAKATLGGTTLVVNFPTDMHKQYDTYQTGAIVMIIITTFLSGLVILATVYDINLHVTNPSPEQIKFNIVKEAESQLLNGKPQLTKWTERLLCFSAYKNFNEMFARRSSSDTLEIFNAIRVLSMCWVVFGHMGMLRILSQPVAYPQNPSTYMKNARDLLFVGGFYAVDTFFWVTGVLIAIFLLMEIQRNKTIDIKRNTIRRVLRIIPLYAFGLFFFWALDRYFAEGPMVENPERAWSDCADRWWGNMLFINNLLPNITLSSCMAWSWYLPNDMQFYIITCALMYVYHHYSQKITWGIFAGSTVACSIINAIVISAYELTPHANGFFGKDYVRPWCRYIPYGVGTACGIVIMQYRVKKANGVVFDPIADKIGSFYDKKFVPQISFIIGLISINLLLIIQFSNEFYYIDHFEDNWSPNEYAVFRTFYYPVYAFSLSFMLLPILLGYMSLITHILSAGIWVPLARLSYSCYIVHASLMRIYAITDRSSYYIDDFTFSLDVIYCVVLTFGFSQILYLLLEAPAANLERIIYGRK